MPIFSKKKKLEKPGTTNVWARPEMLVTFRAEIMPGIEREKRSFRVKTVLTNGRVILHDFTGEHRKGAFEPLNFLRDAAK